MVKRIAAFVLSSLLAATAAGQTIKIGVVNTFTGAGASFGDQADKAMKLYMKSHGSELPPGVKVELVVRDDGGPNPDVAKRLAQELVVRDKVQLLAGGSFTPSALGITAVADEAKLPFVLLNAGTSMITTRSPYVVRLSFTLWQSCYPLGEWAAKRFKTAYTLVTDYAPGHDAEAAFTQAFRAAAKSSARYACRCRIPISRHTCAGRTTRSRRRSWCSSLRARRPQR
jgi:branched-chain amino acid transport system substrate-binding protein